MWGWFDVKDNRHWPARLQTPPPTAAAGTTAKPGDLAAAYLANTSDGQPQGLTLEQLRLRFETNVYFAALGQGGFNWGVTWARHQSYTNLAAFQSALGLDTGSETLDVAFADPLRHDFRLRPEDMARLKESYPQGPVPGVVLGVQADSVR